MNAFRPAGASNVLLVNKVSQSILTASIRKLTSFRQSLLSRTLFYFEILSAKDH
jgi:hypothetical protein